MNTAYRVWDGEQMHYWDDEGLSLVITGGGWSLYRHTSLSLHPIRLADSTQKNAALMWGTGLKDKTGKGIYEKDIDMADEEPMIVIMENGHYGLKFLDGSAYFDYSVDWEECEIGGDIYQNPELLEGAE
ncbi:YopX family protein [Bacillus spizizenii]|nr:YopX family protein [Bacillus spizizenii]